MDLVPLSSLISNRHRDSLPRAKRVQMVELMIGFLRVGVPDYPEGVRPDNLLVAPPRPRNPLLADAFKRAGIVERTGCGIDTISYEGTCHGPRSKIRARS